MGNEKKQGRSIWDVGVGSAHVSAGHTCHMLACFFSFSPTVFFPKSYLEALSLLDPRNAGACISSSWLSPEASQCCDLASVCFLEVVEIFIIQAIFPGAKKQVSLFLRKVNRTEEKTLGCFGKQNKTLKTGL